MSAGWEEAYCQRTVWCFLFLLQEVPLLLPPPQLLSLETTFREEKGSKAFKSRYLWGLKGGAPCSSISPPKLKGHFRFIHFSFDVSSVIKKPLRKLTLGRQIPEAESDTASSYHTIWPSVPSDLISSHLLSVWLSSGHTGLPADSRMAPTWGLGPPLFSPPHTHLASPSLLPRLCSESILSDQSFLDMLSVPFPYFIFLRGTFYHLICSMALCLFVVSLAWLKYKIHARRDFLLYPWHIVGAQKIFKCSLRQYMY